MRSRPAVAQAALETSETENSGDERLVLLWLESEWRERQAPMGIVPGFATEIAKATARFDSETISEEEVDEAQAKALA